MKEKEQKGYQGEKWKEEKEKEKQILLEPGKQDAGRHGGRPRLSCGAVRLWPGLMSAPCPGHRQALVFWV